MEEEDLGETGFFISPIYESLIVCYFITLHLLLDCSTTWACL